MPRKPRRRVRVKDRPDIEDWAPYKREIESVMRAYDGLVPEARAAFWAAVEPHDPRRFIGHHPERVAAEIRDHNSRFTKHGVKPLVQH